MLRYGEIPKGDSARDRWAALGKSARKQVLRDARRGRAVESRAVAAVAVGWAWAVLGPPEARRRVSVADVAALVIEVVTSTPATNIVLDIFDGRRTSDANPFVRRAARRIEAANPVRESGRRGVSRRGGAARE